MYSAVLDGSNNTSIRVIFATNGLWLQDRSKIANTLPHYGNLERSTLQRGSPLTGGSAAEGNIPVWTCCIPDTVLGTLTIILSVRVVTEWLNIPSGHFGATKQSVLDYCPLSCGFR
jgi:hypothetical protein